MVSESGGDSWGARYPAPLPIASDIEGLLHTRHLHLFKIPVSPSIEADSRHPDKEKLREAILTLRALGMSYRETGREVGLHWTWIGQILKILKK